MNIAAALSGYALISVCLGFAYTSIDAAPSPEVSRTPVGNQLRRLWAPVADEVYLQEVCEKVTTDKPVTTVALRGDLAYAVVGGAVKLLREAVLLDAEGAPDGVN